MFVPAHNVDGCLRYAIGGSDNLLFPDTATYQYIEALIAGGNWTYLQIGKSPNCEIVRVTAAADNSFTIVRAIDGTAAISFGSLAPLNYVATAASVEDLLSTVPGNDVQITADLPLKVTHESTNQFHLALPTPVFNSEDDSVLVTGAYPEYNIVINKQAAGCC